MFAQQLARFWFCCLLLCAGCAGPTQTTPAASGDIGTLRGQVQGLQATLQELQDQLRDLQGSVRELRTAAGLPQATAGSPPRSMGAAGGAPTIPGMGRTCHAKGALLCPDTQCTQSSLAPVGSQCSCPQSGLCGYNMTGAIAQP